MTVSQQPYGVAYAADLLERARRLAADLGIDSAERSSPGSDPSVETLAVLVPRLGRLSELLSNAGGEPDAIDELAVRLLIADLALVARLIRAQTSEAGRTLEKAAADLASASAELKAARAGRDAQGGS